MVAAMIWHIRNTPNAGAHHGIHRGQNVLIHPRLDISRKNGTMVL